jgi:hypothetical protein
MKSSSNIGLADLTAVYSGNEGDLWELLMGQQIHIGGLKSSMDTPGSCGTTDAPLQRPRTRAVFRPMWTSTSAWSICNSVTTSYAFSASTPI